MTRGGSGPVDSPAVSRRPGPADEPPELPEGEVLLLDPARDLWRPRPRRVLLALVVVGGLTSVGVWFAVRPSPDERARDLLHLARTELAASHPDQAGPLLAEALRHDPRNAEAHYLSGVAAVLGGRPADAEAAFREALALRTTASTSEGSSMFPDSRITCPSRVSAGNSRIFFRSWT